MRAQTTQRILNTNMELYNEETLNCLLKKKEVPCQQVKYLGHERPGCFTTTGDGLSHNELKK